MYYINRTQSTETRKKKKIDRKGQSTRAQQPLFRLRFTFLRNFANPLMMSPSHCHLMVLIPVHRLHYHVYYSFSLSLQTQNLLFSINRRSVFHFFGLISRMLRPFPDLISLPVLLGFFLFSSLCLIRVLD